MKYLHRLFVFTAIIMVVSGNLCAEEKKSADSSFARFAGKWIVNYSNGAVRQYAIEPGGEVSWLDFDPAKKCQITAAGRDYLIDFEDGKIERITKKGSTIVIEHFDPKAKYPNKLPGIQGTGTKVKK